MINFIFLLLYNIFLSHVVVAFSSEIPLGFNLKGDCKGSYAKVIVNPDIPNDYQFLIRTGSTMDSRPIGTDLKKCQIDLILDLPLFRRFEEVDIRVDGSYFMPSLDGRSKAKIYFLIPYQNELYESEDTVEFRTEWNDPQELTWNFSENLQLDQLPSAYRSCGPNFKVRSLVQILSKEANMEIRKISIQILTTPC